MKCISFPNNVYYFPKFFLNSIIHHQYQQQVYLIEKNKEKSTIQHPYALKLQPHCGMGYRYPIKMKLYLPGKKFNLV